MIEGFDDFIVPTEELLRTFLNKNAVEPEVILTADDLNQMVLQSILIEMTVKSTKKTHETSFHGLQVFALHVWHELSRPEGPQHCHPTGSIGHQASTAQGKARVGQHILEI